MSPPLHKSSTKNVLRKRFEVIGGHPRVFAQQNTATSSTQDLHENFIITAEGEEDDVDDDKKDVEDKAYFTGVCDGKDIYTELLHPSLDTNANKDVLEDNAKTCDNHLTYAKPIYSPTQITIILNISWLLSQKQNFSQDFCRQHDIFIASPHDRLILPCCPIHSLS